GHGIALYMRPVGSRVRGLARLSGASRTFAARLLPVKDSLDPCVDLLLAMPCEAVAVGCQPFPTGLFKPYLGLGDMRLVAIRCARSDPQMLHRAAVAVRRQREMRLASCSAV